MEKFVPNISKKVEILTRKEKRKMLKARRLAKKTKNRNMLKKLSHMNESRIEPTY